MNGWHEKPGVNKIGGRFPPPAGFARRLRPVMRTIKQHRTRSAVVTDTTTCELCTPTEVVLENSLAYVRYDNNSLSRGHVLVVPKRHVANFFDMSAEEQAAVVALLNQAQRSIQTDYAPDGYNIGINIGKAGGQSRMHVHVHLIPRYAGDVPDPRGGIRCVLAGSRPGNK
jgi:diadenosine tetraphosphate (Ap4A) HIT family hydrolase